MLQQSSFERIATVIKEQHLKAGTCEEMSQNVFISFQMCQFQANDHIILFCRRF